MTSNTLTPYKWMRCARCKHRFPLMEIQVRDNQFFRCPACKGHNYGSWDGEPDGTLIGRTASEVRRFWQGKEQMP